MRAGTVDGQVYQQLVFQAVNRCFLRLGRNWVAWALGLPLCSCTGRPGYYSSPPLPSFPFSSSDTALTGSLLYVFPVPLFPMSTATAPS